MSCFKPSLHPQASQEDTYELLTGNKPNVSYFRVFGSKCYVLQKRSKSSKLAPKVYEGFMLDYDSNSHAYRVFNKDSDCVETTCDAVFDETNGSQVEEYDLDIIDDEEAPCDALQRMAIGEVRPQDPSEQQVVAPNDTTPLAQNHDQDDEDEKEEDQEDENEDEQDQPHDEDQDHDQEESNDQWGAKDDGVQERSKVMGTSTTYIRRTTTNDERRRRTTTRLYKTRLLPTSCFPMSCPRLWIIKMSPIQVQHIKVR
jgi:hypothetical protein